MIIVGGAGLLLLGACSPSSYQTTFPEPAYVKVSTNNGAYAPYPDNPIGQQELVYWYDSLTTPMTVVAEVPPTPIVTKGPGPVILDSNDFSAKLYRDRTEIKKKDKDGNWLISQEDYRTLATELIDYTEGYDKIVRNNSPKSKDKTTDKSSDKKDKSNI